MGYYVNATKSNITFKPEYSDPAVLAEYVKERMFTDAALKSKASGGAYPRPTGDYDVAEYHWYSWTNSKECREATDIWQIIEQFVDGVEHYPDGSWQINFDSKVGQEDVLFETLAPSIVAGSFVNWRGEDGEHYRWEFDGEYMHVLEGSVVYRKPDAFDRAAKQING